MEGQQFLSLPLLTQQRQAGTSNGQGTLHKADRFPPPGTGRVLPNRLRILTHIIKGSLDVLEAFLKVSHAIISAR